MNIYNTESNYYRMLVTRKLQTCPDMSNLPSDKAIELRNFINRLGNIYGTNFPNAKMMSPRLFGSIILCITMLIMQGNGFILIWPDILKICNSILLESIALQLMIRLFNRFVRDDENTTLLIQKSINIFYMREEKVIQNRIALDSHIKTLKIALKAYLTIGLITYTVPSISALIYSMIYKEFFLFVPFYVPFTDPERFMFDFLLNTLILVLGSLLIGIIMISGDLFNLYFILQTIPMVNMIRIKIRNFGSEIEKFQETQRKKYNLFIKSIPSSSTKAKTLEIIFYKRHQQELMKIEKHLVTVIQDSQNYDEYVKMNESFIEMTTFVAVSLNSLSMGLAILLAYIFSITIGVSTFLLFFIEVLLPCLLGSIVSYQNEKLLKEFCSFPWYELSIPSQKIFLQHIHMCQNLAKLTVPIFGELEMELFAQILNEAYAYLMFILNFVH
ncbi:unnamed protein product [Chironomus riparius]|uniref:Odorant receptor n=1 Tax=Chironomus riparius TaxID=315576 RepID=A0A9N9WSQ7_9DIPT|nr:unnamed protein product [Chironomus riparius]